MFLFVEGRVLEHLYSLWRKESELVDGSDEAEQGSHLLRGAARRHVRHLDHTGAGRHDGSDLMLKNVSRETFKPARSIRAVEARCSLEFSSADRTNRLAACCGLMARVLARTWPRSGPIPKYKSSWRVLETYCRHRDDSSWSEKSWK